jgi:hypothetical protein
MADSPEEFQAKVDEWVKAVPERILAVFRESTQRLASDAANAVPIDTGFARASVQASLESMPLIDPTARGDRHGSYSLDTSNLSVVIAGAELTSTIYVGWTASYIQYLEYGHSNQAPQGFVRVNAERWPTIVAEVSAQLKSQTA